MINLELRKGDLGDGEVKSIQTDRVVLVAGSKAEVALVREIYRRFVKDLASEQKIADTLNTRGAVRESGHPWTRGTIHHVLINENYIGNNVWNRVSFKLRKKRVHNHPDMWIRADGAFPGIVDRQLFDAAQTIIRARTDRMSDQAMLDGLVRLRETAGFLSDLIIDEAEGIPCSRTYRGRFGSLSRAYQLVGYAPRRDLSYVEINRGLRTLHPQVLSAILDEPSWCWLPRPHGSGKHDHFSQWRNHHFGSDRAMLPNARAAHIDGTCVLTPSMQPDVTIAVRMDAANQAPLDYYLLPRIDIETAKIQLAEANGLGLDGYRFDTLETFYEYLEPVIVAEAA